VTSRALRQLGAEAWPLLQGTAAATTAWIIAKHVVDHHEPFFAPIAAVVALNTVRGERGRNALRLLLGVVLGIAAGELTVAALGGGYGRLALATFVAMAVARALDGARIVIAQAGASAILTVAVANGEAGTQRLVDALIGAGVALVFSQLLFSPEPVSLVRRAEVAALARMAKGLELTARALSSHDDTLAEQAMRELRDLRDPLAELARTRRASTRIVRHTLVWQARRTAVVRENESAEQLDLLGSSCLLLARTVTATSPPEQRSLAPSVHEVAGALAALARRPGDRPTRQRAADCALAVATEITGRRVPPEWALAAAITSLRMVTADIMLFAGVDPVAAPSEG
jgi:uncharacterized membrane protein YgaE (UPF0421/DUF939 family)